MKAATVALAAGMAVAVGIAACGDGGGPVGPNGRDDTGGSSPTTSGSVEATVTVSPREDGQQSVTVRFRGEQLALGAYQGRLRFDASTLSLVEVVRGQGGEGASDPGEFHVLNDRRADEGELRFAAYAVEGFADPVALELAFETSRAIQASDLELRLEVVGTVEGRPIPMDRTAVREVLR